MKCKYRENDYCIYSNRTCNPRAASCITNNRNKIQNHVLANKPKATSSSPKSMSATESIFPNEYIIVDSFTPDTEVYVYGGVLTANADHLTDCSVTVQDLIDSEKYYQMYLVYDSFLHRYYIANKVLQYYLKKQYHPNFVICYAKIGDCSEPLVGREFADVSLLKLYGYTVGKTNGMPKAHRHIILKYLIDNDIMKGFEIINLLQFNLLSREGNPRYDKAVSDWKEDLQFVSDYLASDKRKKHTLWT